MRTCVSTLITAMLLLSATVQTVVAGEFVVKRILEVDNPTSALFGGSVASAGYVDEDNYPDILVGDVGYNYGEGRVYVFSGYTGELIHEIPSHCPNDRFGYCVAGIGDIDDGGADDFMVGSPDYEPGTPNSDIGVTIYRGEDFSIYMIFRTTDYSFIEDGSLFGASIAPVPDADGDGVADVIIGAPQHDGSRGAYYVMSTDDGSVICLDVGDTWGYELGCSVLGGFFHENPTKTPQASYVVGASGWSSNSGLVELQSYDCDEFDSQTGNQVGMHFGWSLANVGVQSGAPFDTDWFVVGAPGFDRSDIEGSNHGRVYLCREDGNEFDEWWIDVQDIEEGGHAGADFGHSVAKIGDVVGDERIEIAIGAPDFDAYWGTDVGAVFIYTVDGDGYIFGRGAAYGELMEDRFGWSICGVGDIDGDGWDEFAVGTNTEGTNLGRVYIFGGGQTTDYYWSSSGTEPGDEFGWSVAPAGDYNNDGLLDIVVGAPSAGNYGKHYVFTAGTSNILEEAEVPGIGIIYGQCVAHCGDLSMDGIDDILVADPLYDTGGKPGCGVLTARSFFDGIFWDEAGEKAHEHFGWSVFKIGDVTNDGVGDVVVGAPNYSSASASNVGRVYVLSGTDGSKLTHLVVTGDEPTMWLGFSVCDGGNSNGGKPDYIAGARYGASYHGSAHLFSGDDGSLIHEWAGEGYMDEFGYCVLGGFDYNGDDIDDFAIGAPGNDEGGYRAGKVYVYSGSTYEQMETFVGTSPESRLGSHLSLAIHPYAVRSNSADLLIGAAGEDSTGRVYCYEGGTGELLYTLEGSHEGDQFGESIAGIGDIDNDDICDVVVGAAKNDFGGEDAGKVYIYSGKTALICGDANASGSVDIDDVVYLIAFIFSGGQAPDPYDSGDANCSETVDIDDVVWLINFIFSGGPAPCDCGP